VSELRGEYTDIPDMVRELKTLDKDSAAFGRRRETIIKRALPVADHVARRFKGRGEPQDDLFQVACVGLINAVNRFDPDTGSDFLSFAVPTVMGEVRRHFRDNGWAVKVPRRLKELRAQLGGARAELAQRNGRAPTATELAGYLGVDREVVVEAMIADAGYSALSIDIKVCVGDESPAMCEILGEPDAALNKVVDVETVRPLIAALPDRERKVLALRFMGDLTQEEIAQRLGYSQMHISRLLSRILNTLREKACEQDGRPVEVQSRASSTASRNKNTRYLLAAG
jgi:RNA polymerase sigma-B factor